MSWTLCGGGGSGGFTLGQSQNIFSAATKAAAETLRDDYAAANAAWLAFYNGDTNLNIRLEYEVNGDAIAEYQVRNSGGNAWLTNSSAKGVKGDKGDDGTGGGGFGFAVYENTGIPQLSLTDIWLQINNNGLGVETNQTDLPDGVTTLLGVNSIDISQVPINSVVEIRLSLEFTPTTNNQLFEYRVSGVNSLGTFHLEDFGGQLRQGADVLHTFVRTMKVYVFDLVTTQNPLIVEVRTSAPSSVRCERFFVEVNSKGA